MTRDDVIKMAREADIDWHRHWDDEENRLERFAALVAAHEREKLAKYFEDNWRHRWTDEEIAKTIRARVQS